MLAATVTTAPAATWHIEAEPEGNNRIAALAALAAGGDTIMIGPGLYYEHIDAAGKALTFIGRDGRESTILDGSRPFAGEGGSIIYTYNRPGPISVVGLTMQHGQGSDTDDFLGRFGGAIHINNDINHTGSLYAQDCSFLDNDVVGGDSGNMGGAIGVNHGNVVHLENCIFRDNEGLFDGAVMTVFGGDLTVFGCEIDLGEMYYDIGIVLDYMDEVRIEDCIIKGSPDSFNPVGMSFCGRVCEMRRNRIINNGTSGTVMVTINACGPPTNFVFEDNLVWLTAAQPHVWARSIYAGTRGSSVYRRNTFVGDGLDHDTSVGDPVFVEHNIFVDGVVDVFNPPGGCVCCNDLWETTLDLWPGVHAENNISADPMFCDPERGDFTISRRSPCSADSVPEGCEAMGAFPPGCDQLPVKKMTWGGLKNLLRRDR